MTVSIYTHFLNSKPDFLMAEKFLSIHTPQFILSDDGRVGWSHSLAMTSSTAVSIDVQVSLWDIDLESSRNAMAGSAVSFAFSFLRNLHPNYHNGWTE